MYTIKVNRKEEFKTELHKTNQNKLSGIINGKEFDADIINVRDGVYHMVKDNASFHLEIVKHIAEEKQLVVKINNTVYNLDVKDKYDELLRSLGLDSLAAKKVNDIKA